MIEELIVKIWSNPRFHELAKLVEKHWLAKELGLPIETIVDAKDLRKLTEASTLLACSQDETHRAAAYRSATYAYDLRGEQQNFEEALRVVLSRLGNFPALSTKDAIEQSFRNLPLRLAIEEEAFADQHTVDITGERITLTDFQHQLWGRLTAKQRVAISAPTSAGKSFVLQSFLAQHFSKGKSLQVVYLVPTRALIAQVSSDLQNRFSGDEAPPEIFSIPPDEKIEFPTRAVHVLTQERAQLLLESNPLFAPDLVIVDEAHTIEDGARGVLLQWVVDDLIVRREDVQILFASPTVRNLDVFGALFGLANVVPFKSTEPTVAQNFIFADVKSSKKGVVAYSFFDAVEKSRIELGRKTISAVLASKRDRLVHIPLSMAGTGASLIYANGAAETEIIALQLADSLSDRTLTPKRQALVDLCQEVVHKNYVLAICVKVGVGFHYGNIPTILRQAIETAFKEGEIDFLVCTSTLLQGVNLPAKHIFMSAPEKGNRRPLQSTEFWNLSGRAGRLRREFQGNIFLIDYDKWKSYPLNGPKDALIRPAMQVSIQDDTNKLLAAMLEVTQPAASVSDDVESSFNKLFTDFHAGTLERTFSRLGIAADDESFADIKEALSIAAERITLPSQIVKRSGNLSVYRQQNLYERLREIIALGREDAENLIPAHPREESAFDSYAGILKLTYELFFDRDPSRGLPRFHALIAHRWMNGWPLPRIIQAQINRAPNPDTRKVIRSTLDLIEREIRFNVARVFSCYNSILIFTLDQLGFVDLAAQVPGIPLFLEVGASDQTMISFMALGLSRVTATRLNELVADKGMNTSQARTWLRARPLESFGLPALLIEEVRMALVSD